MKTAQECRDLWELIERVGAIEVRAAVVSSSRGEWVLLVGVPGRIVPAEVASEAEYLQLAKGARGDKSAGSGALVYVSGEVQPSLFSD